jgi:hypothetical protein
VAERVIPARTVRTCDRCSAELTEENTKQNRRDYLRKATQYRFIRVGAVLRALGGYPQPVVSEIHMCDGCWWEFDRLFLQGQPVNLAPGVRRQDPKWIPTEHGREAEITLPTP